MKTQLLKMKIGETIKVTARISDATHALEKLSFEEKDKASVFKAGYENYKKGINKTENEAAYKKYNYFMYMSDYYYELANAINYESSRRIQELKQAILRLQSAEQFKK